MFANNDVPSLHNNDTMNLGLLEIECLQSHGSIWPAAENLTCFTRSFGVIIRQTLDHYLVVELRVLPYAESWPLCGAVPST